jgi:RimJ/RimL family protein N-acetyltransferase
MVAMAVIRGRERPAFDPRPVVLEGPRLRLEPLRMEHAEELFEAVRDPDIWTWLSFPPPASAAETADYVRSALNEQIRGEHLPWLTRRRGDRKAIGTTRFAHIDRTNRSVEIGWSMLSREARGTGLNAEAKYLQLRHAFEDLGAIRVWLNTDERNKRSQRAMEKIGAVAEARHRQDRVMPNGHIRTSVFYSFIDSDWPEVRRRLEEGLPRP